jgi:hypothetical protein
MRITPKTRSQYGVALCAMLCVGVTTGCRKHTVPWEHPTAFNKAPVCDESGPCEGDGCYVPPPPVMNSDCYGYQFTCWHPWPEHCQPQCNGEGDCLPMATQPVAPMPTYVPEPAPAMPPAEIHTAPPVSPSEPPMPSSGSSSSESSSSGGSSLQNQTWSRPRYEPPQSTASAAPRAAQRDYAPPTSAMRDSATTSNYGHLSAVADSNTARRDNSVRTVSSVTRLQSPGTTPGGAAHAETPRDGQTDPSTNATRDGLQRFRW